MSHGSVAAGRRTRKRERTRQGLLVAARDLIAEHGVARLRVGDVTERTDVALGSFYTHFETKDAIVQAVVEDAIRRLADAIGDVGDQLADPAEAMSVGVRRLVDLSATDPGLARLLISLEESGERFERLIWGRAHRILARGVGGGRFAAGDVDLTLSIAIAGVLAAIRAGLRPGADPAALGRDAATVLLRAVGLDGAAAAAIAARPLPEIAP